MAADYDSPWKEALDAYFEAFLALLFPEVHALIDWSRGYESLDKEFQQGAKVWTIAGVEQWVLIHVECRRHATPTSRCAYRVFDRYNRPGRSVMFVAARAAAANRSSNRV